MDTVRETPVIESAPVACIGTVPSTCGTSFATNTYAILDGLEEGDFSLDMDDVQESDKSCIVRIW